MIIFGTTAPCSLVWMMFEYSVLTRILVSKLMGNTSFY